MTRTGPTAVLEVAKKGAIYHGLAMILTNPLPKADPPKNSEGNEWLEVLIQKVFKIKV